MNVVSELRKRTPDPTVVGWFDNVDASELYLSVLVVGEIRSGIERLRRRDPPQARALERWLATLKREFADRVLPVSAAVAETWGRMNARSPVPTVDGLIAATALVHDLVLVTREADRLRPTGVAVLDPWT